MKFSRADKLITIQLNGLCAVFWLLMKLALTLFILVAAANASFWLLALVLIYLWHTRQFPFCRITDKGVEF